MKKDFSNKWKASKQPRKQRKYLANAPKHIKKKFVAAPLSKDLREKHSRKSFPIRKGDKVKVMRGNQKGKLGKVENVNYKTLKLYIENIHFVKKDGARSFIPIHPSKVQIQELILDDRKRKKALERTKRVDKK
jgi:large subunit ribosomal protein L24